MDHDGDADSHGDSDGECGGSEAVSVKTREKVERARIVKEKGREGMRDRSRARAGARKAAARRMLSAARNPGPWNPGIKGGGREKECEEKTEK